MLGMGNEMRMGKHSLQNRNFFEQDEEFPDELKRTLDGYNEAARMAAITARHAARSGALKSIREAQWWETVTQTIEECLRVAIDREVEFSMPTPPEFDVA
jgi:hypothetical protein